MRCVLPIRNLICQHRRRSSSLSLLLLTSHSSKSRSIAAYRCQNELVAYRQVHEKQRSEHLNNLQQVKQQEQSKQRDRQQQQQQKAQPLNNCGSSQHNLGSSIPSKFFSLSLIATQKNRSITHHRQLIVRQFSDASANRSSSQLHHIIETFRARMAASWDNLPKPNVIFVLGGPGSGKGTQCSLIAKEYGYVHLSAGDLLRKEQNTPGSEFGALIDGHIRNGTIVPVEITCSLLENAMLENMISLKSSISGDEPIPVGNFLIDGFPRNQNNLEGWKKQVDDKINLKFVLFFECSKDVCVQRCLERGKNSGRTDDNPESMAKRLDTYMNQTMPIVDYYDQTGIVRRLDAEKSVEEVFADVQKLFVSDC